MPETDHGRLRILVLEDEFIIADEIASILADAGHVVVGPVPSVEEALGHLDAKPPPDAAIIDANIRGGSSASVARRLEALGVPFCLCTGYRSNDLVAEFGDAVIVQKPVSPGTLLSVLRSLMSERAGG